jgi:hypothetical protein
MASEKDILDRRKEMSDKISTQVRTLGIGLLAFTWGIVVSDSAVAKGIAADLKWHLLLIGCLAIVVILADFLQYACGHQVALRTLRKMEADGKDSAEYDYTDPFWIWQTRFFNIKQIVLIVATVYLLAAIVTYLVVRVY